MKEKVNIICILWVGNFRRRKFTADHVEKLRASVNKHIDRPYDFYCLTNYEGSLPADKIDLIHPEWPGWWAKVELHRPDLPAGRTLYLDLDSHVVRSLQPILDFKGDLVMFPTPIAKYKWDRLKGFGWVPKYQAATMLFTPFCEPMNFVWDKFIDNPDKWMKRYRSEQDVMGDWIPNQPMFPSEWMIKLGSLVDHKMNTVPDDVIIVTGQPANGMFHRIEQQMPWLEAMARK